MFAKTARTIQKASTVTSARTRSIAPMESAGMRRMSVNLVTAITSTPLETVRKRPDVASAVQSSILRTVILVLTGTLGIRTVALASAT